MQRGNNLSAVARSRLVRGGSRAGQVADRSILCVSVTCKTPLSDLAGYASLSERKSNTGIFSHVVVTGERKTINRRRRFRGEDRSMEYLFLSSRCSWRFTRRTWMLLSICRTSTRSSCDTLSTAASRCLLADSSDCCRATRASSISCSISHNSPQCNH